MHSLGQTIRPIVLKFVGKWNDWLIWLIDWLIDWLIATGAYNTSIVASSSRMFSAKSQSLGCVHSSQSTPAVWFDEPSSPAETVPPPRRGDSVRHPPRTPSPPPTDSVESGPQPGREPSPPGDHESTPLLRPRSVSRRSTSSDAVESSASLIAECSPDRRSLWLRCEVSNSTAT